MKRYQIWNEDDDAAVLKDGAFKRWDDWKGTMFASVDAAIVAANKAKVPGTWRIVYAEYYHHTIRSV